jgi:hypothetical protein
MRRGPKQRYRNREVIPVPIEKVELEILDAGGIPYQRILANTLKTLVEVEVQKGKTAPKHLRALAEAEESAALHCEVNCEEHRARARVYQDLAAKKIDIGGPSPLSRPSENGGPSDGKGGEAREGTT